MFFYSVIGDNTPENRDHLEKLGWISKYTQENANTIVTASNTGAFSCIIAVQHNWFKDYQSECIDCRNNPALFQAVTAMRDDSDYMQWFYSTGWRDGNDQPIPDKWVLCTCNTLEEFGKMNNSPNSYSKQGFGWRKASLSELKEHFKLTPADEEIKKTEAEIHLSVKCDCPYCEGYIDLYSDLSGQCIDIFEYAESKWPVEVTCPECHRSFEVRLNN